MCEFELLSHPKACPDNRRKDTPQARVFPVEMKRAAVEGANGRHHVL
jgi:hypothetical protein